MLHHVFGGASFFMCMPGMWLSCMSVLQFVYARFIISAHQFKISAQ